MPSGLLQCLVHQQPLTIFSFLSPLQWQGETQEFCPNAKIVLVGCKLDMRTDLNTLRELSKQRLIPVTHEQVCFSSCPWRAQGGEASTFLQDLLVQGSSAADDPLCPGLGLKLV